MSKQKETIEYIKYQEAVLPDAEKIQNDFQYWKGIEKLDPNIALKWDIWWSRWHIIQEGTTTFEQRDTLRFDWDAVTVSDYYSWELWKYLTRVEINHQDLPEDNYWRDNDGYFKLPVWSNMY